MSSLYPTFSIIVPTPDGGTLPLLRDSLQGQLREGDEVLIIGDTFDRDLDELATVVRSWGWRYEEHDAGYMGWGHPQINYGMEIATGDYLLFQDDDDLYMPDALLNIRRAVRHLDPPRPLLFKFKAMRFGGMTFWREQGRVEEGWIGGHCLVVPNVKEKLGKWTDRYEGDFDFIRDTLKLWEPLEPVWRQEVIVLAR